MVVVRRRLRQVTGVQRQDDWPAARFPALFPAPVPSDFEELGVP